MSPVAPSCATPHWRPSDASPASQLIQGYKFKAYWFEVFECVRKIFMVGIPCFFPPGATAQLIFGLVISFVLSLIHI